LDIHGSMVRQIVYRVLACVLWSAGVTVAWHLSYPVAIPHDAHALVGVALGLLLVFRTNASYDRYWEGRRLWGSIINNARNLARGIESHLADDPDLAASALCWTTAFPWAAMHRLRGNKGLGPSAEALPQNEAQCVLEANHPPLAAARQLTRILARRIGQGRFSDVVFGLLDSHVQQLVDDLGGCERIHSTPIPYAYMVHLRRAIIAYCVTLPFALVGTFGWWTVLATLLIAYVLLGIEEIGVQIEDPFGTDDNDLPLERYCTVIDDNLGDILARLGCKPAA
jgi:putative membrane protein